MTKNSLAHATGIQSWYMVFVLFIAYTLSSIDRQILTLLVGPIRADLNLSDSEMSLLMGFAFSLLFAIAGLPIGRLSDRKSRRNIIAIGIACWCAMTAACGFAKNFTHLFMARMGVGIGEAALSPAAFSLIADRFPPNRRAFATSVYHLGYPIGAGVAMILGGILIGTLSDLGPQTLGFLGTFSPWQLTFMIVGIPGLLVIGLIYTFTEPERKGLMKIDGKTVDATLSLSDLFQFLAKRWQVYSVHFGAVSLLGLLAIGTAIWYPTFLIRTYDMSAMDAGIYFGSINLLFGAPGLLIGGWLAQKLAARGYTDANIRIMILATAVKTIPLIVGPLMPTWQGALALMAVATFAGQMGAGVTTAAVLDITPNQLRAQVASILLLLVNLIGIGFGATFIALITDFVFGNDNDLRYSISIATAIVAPIILIMLLWVLKYYRAAIAEAQAWQTP